MNICNECIYNRHIAKSKNLGNGCPFEDNPNFVTQFPQGPDDCMYYTCSYGVLEAMRAIRDKNPQVIKFGEEEIQVVPYSTSHKPSRLVERYVEVNFPHRFFIIKDGEIFLMADRLSKFFNMQYGRPQQFLQELDES
jgi:hypothetical protein